MRQRILDAFVGDNATPQRIRLASGWKLILTHLAGTGTRYVTVASDGTLGAGALTVSTRTCAAVAIGASNSATTTCSCLSGVAIACGHAADNTRVYAYQEEVTSATTCSYGFRNDGGAVNNATPRVVCLS
jgi:hypothetical protein